MSIGFIKKSREKGVKAMIILPLKQGSEEWRIARREYITSTDVPKILDIHPFETALDCFERKLNDTPEVVDSFTQSNFDLGHKFEAEMTETLKITDKPVITHEKYRHLLASLDGLVQDNIYEFKYSKTPVVKVPPDHEAQMQTAMLLSDATVGIYVRGTDAKNYQTIIVEPDLSQQQVIVEQTLKFFKRLKSGSAPEAGPRDFHMTDDPRFDDLAKVTELANIYLKLKEELTEEIVLHHPQKRLSNGKVTVTRSMRKGSIKYSTIPEIKSMDLEKYRGNPSEVITVKVVRNFKNGE